MNNEPVAYLMVERNDGNSYIQMGIPTRDEKISHHPYPLYTHPAKTLTDEEIKDFIFPQFVFEDGGIGMPLDEFLATVRAILRKAQEK